MSNEFFGKDQHAIRQHRNVARHFLRRARQRALLFTWDKTARRIVQLFEMLHQKKKLINRNRLLNVFAPAEPIAGAGTRRPRDCRSVLLSMNAHYEQCLMRDAVYPLPVEDGLVLSVLKAHRTSERSRGDSCCELVADETEARAILKRVLGLINGTA